MRSRSTVLLLAASAVALMLQPAAGLSMFTQDHAAKYAPELMGVALILVYLISAYFGAKKNREIAENWIRCEVVASTDPLGTAVAMLLLSCDSSCLTSIWRDCDPCMPLHNGDAVVSNTLAARSTASSQMHV
jgi:hypothetical protein